MAGFNSTEYDFAKFGETVTVPNADIAKIMYYIDCVCTVIEYNDQDLSRYRNYSNWANMSDEEDRLIFILALSFAPKELENRVFFNNSRLCGDSNNQFYEIGQVQRSIVIVQSILIGGQQRSVKKIMAYKPVWMERNYYIPMKNLIYRFSPEGQREEAIRRQMISQACTIS